MIELNNIVEEVFGVDIKSSRRFKDIIEARMVFSKILRERGVPYTKIGEYLGRDHACIINYIQKFNTYFREKSLNDKYEICQKAFFDNCPINKSSINIFKTPTLEAQFGRFNSILKIMQDKTPIGKEDVLEEKIIEFLNDL